MKSKKIEGNISPILKLDRTLTKDGYAADAKVTGKKIAEANARNDEKIVALSARVDSLIAMDESETYNLECYIRGDGNGDPSEVGTATIETDGFKAKLTVHLPRRAYIQNTSYDVANVPGHLLPMENVGGADKAGLNIIDGKITYFWDGPSLPSGPFDMTLYYPLKYAPVAELADARVGEDGTVYRSAGEAIRSQIVAVRNELSESNVLLVNYNADDMTASHTGVEIGEHYMRGSTVFLNPGSGAEKLTYWDEYAGAFFHTIDDQGYVYVTCIDTEGKVTTASYSIRENGGGGGDVPSMDAIVEAVLAALPNGDEVEY